MKTLLLICGFLCAATACAQQVNYLGLQLRYKGLLLLEASDDDKAFYYLPTSFRVADSGKGKALSLTKYMGTNEDAPRGGLFNIAFTLSPPSGVLAKAEKFLADKVPGASIRGRVPLWPDSENGRPVNYLISQIGETAEVLVISSTPATVEGNEANIGLLLNPKETTLLTKSLEMASADLALVTELYYEAVVTDLSLRITAPSGPVYRKLTADGRETFTEKDVRKVAGRLASDRRLKIEWFVGGGSSPADEQRALLTERVITMLLHRFLAPASAPKKDGKSKVNYRLREAGLVREDSISITVSADRRLRVPVTIIGQAGDIITPENRAEYIRFLQLEETKNKNTICYIRPDFLPAFPEVFGSVKLELRGTKTGPQGQVLFIDTLNKRVIIPLAGEDDFEYRTAWRHLPSRRIITADWSPITGLTLPLAPPLRSTRVTIARSPVPPQALLRHVIIFRGQVDGQIADLHTISYAAKDQVPDDYITLYHDPNTTIEAEITTITRSYGGTEKQLKLITDDFLLQL